MMTQYEINSIIDDLKGISDPVAVFAGEAYAEIIDNAVERLYRLRVAIEDDYAERDARIEELHKDLVWHLKERDEAVAILERRLKQCSQ